MDAVHHVEALDTTLHTTNRWLNALCEQLGWTDSRRAYHALRGVLHALRDRLPLEETAALAAQLPLLVRGIYYEGWHPSGKPLKERMKAEFLGHVAAEFRNIPAVDVEGGCPGGVPAAFRKRLARRDRARATCAAGRNSGPVEMTARGSSLRYNLCSCRRLRGS